MRKEAKKQSKFKHYILTPVRILKKAKELYVKGLVDCAGRIGYGGAGSAVQISHHPAVVSKAINGGERQRELFRTVPLPLNETRLVTHGERVAPIRNVGNEMGVVMHRQRQRIVGYKYNNRTKMNYHTGVRKMGRIDEDKPCYFEEDHGNDNSKANLLYLYPRSRTSIVNSHARSVMDGNKMYS